MQLAPELQLKLLLRRRRLCDEGMQPCLDRQLVMLLLHLLAAVLLLFLLLMVHPLPYVLLLLLLFEFLRVVVEAVQAADSNSAGCISCQWKILGSS